MIRLLFLAAGFVVLGGLIWHIGLPQIWETVERVGFVAFCIILTPLLVVYLLDAYGWSLTLGQWSGRVGFVRLFMVRMAGEAINVTTPTAMLGGEPMKAYLLTRYQVPMVEGLASVVTAKTIMVVAQIFFMLSGLGVTLWMVGTGEYNVLVALLTLGLLGFGVFLFLLLQRYGIGRGLLAVADACRIRSQRLETWRPQLLDLDDTIRTFYRERRRTFLLALGVHFVAWLTELFEVYAILYFLGAEVGWLSSFSIAAIAVLIKGSVSFVPGGLGAQEGGYLFLLMVLGHDEVTGITFALIRRLREILWILIGLVFLAVLRDKAAVSPTS
ncbi:MAG: flippase-like domain-containing protein [Nitrospira sp. SB0672_bin_25]|nr:flippase-like domain-containing protein [Nitrospira sp. SB0666_bin_27]MYF25024.1 flippase-like domain-containing protein [Nitrospira sp. SB0678_bin_10]MYJ53531.1 flippase-like domain-containing protein [Nitrospira sp. SB0672_bin_25]